MSEDPNKTALQKAIVERLRKFALEDEETLGRLEFGNRRPGLSTALAMAAVALFEDMPQWRVVLVVPDSYQMGIVEKIWKHYKVDVVPDLWTFSDLKKAVKQKGGLPAIEVCIIDDARFFGPEELLATVRSRCKKLVLAQTGNKNGCFFYTS